MFDGESYLSFKYKKAAERIGKQLLEGGAMKGAVSGGAAAQKPTKPQSAREEIDAQREEQIEPWRAEQARKKAIARYEKALGEIAQMEAPQNVRDEIDSQKAEQMKQRTREREEQDGNKAPHFDNPLALELWRLQNGEGGLSEAQIKRNKRISDFPHIVDEKGSIMFGGDQRYFARNTANEGGCASVAATNVIVTLAKQNPEFAREAEIYFSSQGTINLTVYNDLMEEVYEDYIGSMEIVPFNLITDHQGKTKIKPSLGRMTAGYIKGVLNMAEDNGLLLKSEVLPTASLENPDEALDFIENGLDNGCPIDLFTTLNKHDMRMLWEDNATESIDENKFHHVAIVDTMEVDGKTKLIISTWGDMAIIDYDELYESWQSPKAVGTTLTYFSKAENSSETFLSKMTANVELAESIAAPLRALLPD